MGDRAIF